MLDELGGVILAILVGLCGIFLTGVIIGLIAKVALWVFLI